MSESQKKVKELFQLVSTSDRVLVIVKPDPDSLSSAWALKRLLTGKVQVCQVAHVGDIGRIENRAMVRLLRIKTEKLDKVDLSGYSRFAIVDGQPDQFLDLSLPPFDIVIDHHPVVNNFEAAFTDIRPKEGATATILTEYLQRAKMKVPRSLATALCFGIKTDTNSLTRSATRHDVAAYAYLLPKANVRYLRQIEHERISRSDLDLLARAISQVQIRRSFLYVFLEGPVAPDSLVILADIFSGVERTTVVVVGSTYRGRIVMILRGQGPRVDVGRIARSAFGDLGSAGGHRVAARAEIKLSQVPEGVNAESAAEVGAWAKKLVQANLSTRKKSEAQKSS